MPYPNIIIKACGFVKGEKPRVAGIKQRTVRFARPVGGVESRFTSIDRHKASTSSAAQGRRSAAGAFGADWVISSSETRRTRTAAGTAENATVCLVTCRAVSGWSFSTITAFSTTAVVAVAVPSNGCSAERTSSGCLLFGQPARRIRTSLCCSLHRWPCAYGYLQPGSC